MISRTARIAGLTLALLLIAACSAPSSPSSVSAAAIPSVVPASYDQFAATLCSSFTSLIRAVGNPDVNTPSVMSSALDAAVAAHDAGAADQAATAMLDELEAGRSQAAIAARWRPGQSTMLQMDRLLVAFEVHTKAKRALASGAGGTADPQRAFEGAGGVEAWSAVLQGVATIPVPAGATPMPCKAFTGQI